MIKKDIRKMSFRILFQLTVLSALSSAALGQMSTLPPGCSSALGRFITSSCFGSDGITGFFYTLFNLTIPTITKPTVVPPPPDEETQRALTNYYDHLCSQQSCINSYASVVSICLGPTAQLVTMMIYHDTVTHACMQTNKLLHMDHN